jgi:hypothetical protein
MRSRPPPGTVYGGNSLNPTERELGWLGDVRGERLPNRALHTVLGRSARRRCDGADGHDLADVVDNARPAAKMLVEKTVAQWLSAGGAPRKGGEFSRSDLSSLELPNDGRQARTRRFQSQACAAHGVRTERQRDRCGAGAPAVCRPSIGTDEDDIAW